MTQRSLLFVVVTLLLMANQATAQAPTAAHRAEARERFERALSLFDEERYEEARIEFEAAYAAVPSFQVLYNIGNVHAALHHPVRAVDAWERYLTQGGDAIDAPRRSEVEAALRVQRGRVGRLQVTSNVEGAQVTIDGVAVARLPLEAPIPLAIGTYAVGVETAGWQASSQRVEVAGQRTTELALLLERVAVDRGALEITSRMRGAEVRIDGVLAGETPLAGTVPLRPGLHVVEARRLGYLTFRQEVRIEAEGLSRVEVVLAVDPAAGATERATLVLRVPEGATLLVDGEPMSESELVLPVGHHALDVAVDERLPSHVELELASGERRELRPELRWTETARRARFEGAESTRILGATVALGGGAILLGFAGAAIWNEARTSERDELQRHYEACGPGATGICTDEMLRGAERYPAFANAIEVARYIVYPLAAAGLLTAVIGIVVWSSAPSDEAIEADASARLELGPARVSLRGAF